MKGREGKGAPSTDLLVCFPTRAHLRLMPKPICSPARLTDSSAKRRYHHHHHHQPNPLLWAKTKPMGSEVSEPTSPKVTCAGQIKVRKKPSSCKNWQSVMEEIEMIHNNGSKHKKRPTWVEALGFKKDIMQFFTYLRRIRFDFRCFGSIPGTDITSDDDDDEVEDEYEEDQEKQENQVGMQSCDGVGDSSGVFSKWFMVLQEKQKNISNCKELEEKYEYCDDEGSVAVAAPPSNALLLMRCRSAPAKSWLEEEEEEEEEETKKAKLELALQEERNKKESLVLRNYASDFLRISSDIAKETWIVGGMSDPLTRSRSWKR